MLWSEENLRVEVKNPVIRFPIKKRNNTELFIEQFTIDKINGGYEMKTKERRVN